MNAVEVADGLLALAEQATSGPWSYGDVASVAGGGLYGPEVLVASMHFDAESTEPIHRTIPPSEADACGAFIVAARTGAPLLAETVQAVAALCDASEASCQEWGLSAPQWVVDVRRALGVTS